MSLTAGVALHAWIAATVMVTFAVAKWLSLRTAGLTLAQTPQFAWMPVFSVASWRQLRPLSKTLLRTKIADLAIFTPLAIGSWWLYFMAAAHLQPTPWLRGYLALVPFYAFIELASVVVELAFLASGQHLPAHMRRPLLARSINEFWGRRWGVWVSTWLRQVVLARYRRQPLLGMLIVFVVSGLWHEVLVDVPLYVFYRIDVLGTWMLYFLLQAAGIAVERRFFSGRRIARAVFAWAVILLPAPLALNTATLTAIWLDR